MCAFVLVEGDQRYATRLGATRRREQEEGEEAARHSPAPTIAEESMSSPGVVNLRGGELHRDMVQGLLELRRREVEDLVGIDEHGLLAV